MTKTHSTDVLTDYVKLLGLASLILMLVTIGMGIAASVSYARHYHIIEDVTDPSSSQTWTITILWVPLVVQLLILITLSLRVWKHKTNEVIRHYFKFYFLRTFISSCAYVTLWLIYTMALKNGPDTEWISIGSWLSLIGIALVVYIVVQAAYLITRSIPHTDNRVFTEEQVEENYDDICIDLNLVIKNSNQTSDAPATQEMSDSTGAEAPPTPSAQLKLIHKWLLKDTDPKTHRVISAGPMTDLDIPHLTRALNGLVRNRRFHADAHNGARTKETSQREIETQNRDYIEKYLFKPTGLESKGDVEAAIRKFVQQIKEGIISWFGAENRRDRQSGQRDGIAMFPFYTIVFFFSVFLCLAHLFSFAFAFEDKYVQLTDPRRPGALLLNDDLPEDPVQENGYSSFRREDLKDASGFARKLKNNDGPVSAYLRSRLSGTTVELLNKYDPANPVSDTLHEALINDLNRLLKAGSLYDENVFSFVQLRDETRKLAHSSRPQGLIHFNRSLLEDAYPDEIGVGFTLTKFTRIFYFKSAESGIRNSVSGSASEQDQKLTRINNRSLEVLVPHVQSMVENGRRVRIGLVGRADDNGVTGQTPGKDTYSSNSDLAAARIRAVHFELQRQLIAKRVSPDRLALIDWTELPLSNDASLLPRREKNDFEDNKTETPVDDFVLTETFNTEGISSPKVGKDMLKQMESWLYEEPISTSQDASAWWQKLIASAKRNELSVADMGAVKKDIEKWLKLKDDKSANAQREKIEEAVYRIEDPSGSQRSVKVFLYEAATSDRNNPVFKRMALIDYIYFAATTEYGDIRPITSYAKFLAILANMAEFFFIVVLFNSLFAQKPAK
jgi:hypothetical protein